jgi:hypothetical protein
MRSQLGDDTGYLVAEAKHLGIVALVDDSSRSNLISVS